MGARTSIEWTRSADGTEGATWPVIAGCKELSPGCANCYAARLTATRLSQSPKYKGLAVIGAFGHPRFTGDARLWPPHLDWPLRWKKARKIFVADMSDLFYEEVSDEQIAAVFGVMAACPQHTFQLLTKRAKRMREWFGWIEKFAESANAGRGTTEVAVCLHYAQKLCEHPKLRDTTPILSQPWPLPNVHVGVSVESQPYAVERIRYLTATPAVVRFLSCEPLLGPLDLRPFIGGSGPLGSCVRCGCPWDPGHECPLGFGPRPTWAIVGGESGPGSRAFDIAWGLSLIEQCRAAGVACFVKQVGAKPYDSSRPDGSFLSFDRWVNHAKSYIGGTKAICVDDRGRVCANGKDMMRARDEGAFPVRWSLPLKLKNKKGSDMREWPEPLRVRQFPEDLR